MYTIWTRIKAIKLTQEYPSLILCNLLLHKSLNWLLDTSNQALNTNKNILNFSYKRFVLHEVYMLYAAF